LRWTEKPRRVSPDAAFLWAHGYCRAHLQQLYFPALCSPDDDYKELHMKTKLAALLAVGLMTSGLAMAATPQPEGPQNQPQPTPTVAGASAASTASTGGLSTGQVIAVSIAVAATAGVVAGVARNDHNTVTTGTTRTD
jgi:hypothetical protein